jgi:hypothetical protein
MYHQDDEGNRTVFSYLLPDSMRASTDPLRDLVCGRSYTDVMRDVSLLLLKAEFNLAGPVCDLNHRLEFDPGTMRPACVCLPDRLCSDHIYNLVPFYIMLGIASVAALAFCGTGVYKNVKTSQAVGRVTGDRQGMAVLRRVLE